MVNFEKYLKYKNKYLKIKNNKKFVMTGSADLNTDIHNKLLEKWSKFYLGPDSKTVLMRIGTMGSGKTSAIDAFVEKQLGYNANIFSIIDLDRIVTTSGFMTDPDKWWDAQTIIGGYTIVDSIIRNSIKKGMNFSTESTGKFICPSRKVINISTHAGYNTIGVCPYVPYYELKKRVKARAIEEGRDVSTADLEDNMKNMLPRLLDVAPLCDNFYVIHNLVAKGQQPVKLVELIVDFKKFDNDRCCAWKYNDEETTKLLLILKDNKDKYVTQNELDIYQIEQKFLTSLLSTSPHPYLINN